MNIVEHLRARAHEKERGFTLVELIIVIAIIGILIAVAIPVYGNIQDNALEKSLKGDLTNSSKAVEVYKVNSGNYPEASIESLGKVVTVSKENYRYTGGNFLYCTNGNDYAFYVMDKDARMRYYKSSVIGSSQRTNLSSNAVTTCPHLLGLSSGDNDWNSVWLKGSRWLV